MQLSRALLQKYAVNPAEIDSAEISSRVFKRFKEFMSSKRADKGVFAFNFSLKPKMLNGRDLFVNVSTESHNSRDMLFSVSGHMNVDPEKNMRLWLKIDLGPYTTYGATPFYPYGYVVNEEGDEIVDVSQLFERLVFNLKEATRHELEHAYQITDEHRLDTLADDYSAIHHMDKDIKNEKMVDRRQMMQVDRLITYLSSQTEIEAFVSGIYYKAKKMRKPFGEVLDEFIDFVYTQNSKFLQSDQLKQELKSELEDIKGYYADYAAQRFPAAQMGVEAGNRVYDVYDSIGHRSDSDVVLWVWQPGKGLETKELHINPYDIHHGVGYLDANPKATHDDMFSLGNFNTMFQGRYEPDTGRLSMMVPEMNGSELMKRKTKEFVLELLRERFGDFELYEF